MTLVQRASEFAERAHRGQFRKYSGQRYIVHPKAVAELVSTVPHTEEMVAAAWLHDVVEDCPVSLQEIEREFGDVVRELVYWLTKVSKPSDGNRAVRKAMDQAHIAHAPAQAKTIKLADLICNFPDIVRYDPAFAKVWVSEMGSLLRVLMEGDKILLYRARILLSEYKLLEVSCSV